LTLKECKACLDGRIDPASLKGRLAALDAEIRLKRRSRSLLAALLGQASLKSWHEELERVAPDLHLDWLVKQGFSRSDASRLKWLSKDMNDHDNYMRVFAEVFDGLERWGPGSDTTTLRALTSLPFEPASILEIGCGKGVATLPLAINTQARITAIDIDAGALAALEARAAEAGVAGSIDVRCQDMTRMSAPGAAYDVIWSEGSAYILGVKRAFRDWRAYLRQAGVLVLSDMVWRTDRRSPEAQAFWASEYPAMTTVPHRLRQAVQAGFRVVSHFDLGREAFEAYYGPLEARLRALEDRLQGARVLDDLRAELRTYREAFGEFGYEMFVLQCR
jgi:cyclopropane fatty-acyl-phospholipid synthase-like methyltransferase